MTNYKITSDSLHDLCQAYSAGARWYACAQNSGIPSVHATQKDALAELAANGVRIGGGSAAGNYMSVAEESGARGGKLSWEICERIFGEAQPGLNAQVQPDAAEDLSALTAGDLAIIGRIIRAAQK
jgi:hypothetical protein